MADAAFSQSAIEVREGRRARRDGRRRAPTSGLGAAGGRVTTRRGSSGAEVAVQDPRIIVTPKPEFPSAEGQKCSFTCKNGCHALHNPGCRCTRLLSSLARVAPRERFLVKRRREGELRRRRLRPVRTGVASRKRRLSFDPFAVARRRRRALQRL